MPPPIPFALAGFGAWGKHHAKSIQENPAARLVAISAPTEATRAEAAAAYPHAEIFSDAALMIGRGGFDVLDIVTPSHTHRELAIAAMKDGQHVLLEKPMATTVEDCKAIMAAAADSGVKFAIAHVCRRSSR